MWYPVLAWQADLAERKQSVFLLAEFVLMTAPSGSSQVQTVPCWQEIVQATVALPALLSQQAFLLLMFPVHAQTDFFAIGEQFAAFHESPKLDTETGTLALSHPAYILAFWAVGRLQEESASP